MQVEAKKYTDKVCKNKEVRQDKEKIFNAFIAGANWYMGQVVEGWANIERLTMEQRQDLLYEILERHIDNHQHDTILFVAAYSEDGREYKGPSIICAPQKMCTEALTHAFRQNPEFKATLMKCVAIAAWKSAD